MIIGIVIILILLISAVVFVFLFSNELEKNEINKKGVKTFRNFDEIFTDYAKLQLARSFESSLILLLLDGMLGNLFLALTDAQNEDRVLINYYPILHILKMWTEKEGSEDGVNARKEILDKFRNLVIKQFEVSFSKEIPNENFEFARKTTLINETALEESRERITTYQKFSPEITWYTMDISNVIYRSK